MMLSEEKVFKDPVHQYIYVQEKLIWQLIDTKEFQRLRRIKQLGTTFFTYHGAEHSRFTHSLGVYEIARKILSQFERNHYDEWSNDERLLVLVSALLHDIGHGPFSHSFEQIYKINHEEWSKKIIIGDTEINRLLKQVDNELPKKIVDVLNKTYKNLIVNDIISSQLDADRMDYLLRDAYYTGVNYGTFDIERILRVLRPFGKRLLVKESGMHSVEDYLMSRYQMYWQVYFHPVTRSSEILLKKIFIRAKELYESEYNFLNDFPYLNYLFKDNIELHEYLTLDDSFIHTAIYYWSMEKDSILSDLTNRFLNRRLFKYLKFDPFDSIKIKNIEKFFISNGINPQYYLEIDSPSDLPYDIYGVKAEEKGSPIFLLTNNDEIVEISTRSEIIAGLNGRRKTEHKLFYPEDILDDRKLLTKFFEIIND